MELVLATNNKNKVREIKRMLGSYFSNILSMKDVSLDIEIEETGKTFRENAFIKASTVAKLTGRPALADDSGLEVEALGGAPGIYSARYGGLEQNDENNIKKLLQELERVENRKASFTSVLCLCYPDGRTYYTEGKTQGRILMKKDGENGFGYDPVFFSDDLNKSFGKASEDEKNAVSHRGRALEKMRSHLENL